MRFPSTRVIALLGGLAIAGCGASNIQHGGGGTGGNGGGSGTGGGAGSGGGGGGTGGSGGGSGNNCGVQNFMLTKGGTPDLLIIQDRSGSMGMDAMGGNTTPSKWTSITMAINQVVTSVTSVDWGLMMFPSNAGGGFGSCTAPTAPDVACAANNGSKVQAALTGASPNGGTPTTDTINAAVSYFKSNTDGNGHYLLLATDGEPNCGGGLGGGSDAPAAEMAVSNAAAAGIKTVVVGIGANTGADQTLTVMAMNGGMPNMTAGQKPYYEVSSTTDLVNVLNKIAGQIVSCSYALQMAPANPNYVEIDDNNGMKIPRDPTHMNGWDYGPGNLSVNFYGPACDNLQKGVTTGITAVFGCPPVG